jgi:hypothetical protein
MLSVSLRSPESRTRSQARRRVDGSRPRRDAWHNRDVLRFLTREAAALYEWSAADIPVRL